MELVVYLFIAAIMFVASAWILGRYDDDSISQCDGVMGLFMSLFWPITIVALGLLVVTNGWLKLHRRARERREEVLRGDK